MWFTGLLSSLKAQRKITNKYIEKITIEVFEPIHEISLLSPVAKQALVNDYLIIRGGGGGEGGEGMVIKFKISHKPLNYLS